MICSIGKNLIEEVVRCLGPQLSEHKIKVELPDPELDFFADRDMVRRMLINLISNAQRYSPGGTLIQIKVSHDDSDVYISVRDQGVGIAPEAHETIFQKFSSLNTLSPQKGRSTGLGLSFCKFAVEAHHGQILLESEPGKGSCFPLWSPLKMLR